MGQSSASRYTALMAADEMLLFESGDLRIFPELGEVSNSQGESTRLGPVNMKVLILLLGRAGQVVSRNEIFDSVWKNQAVSDDALTRCISDIRGELARLSTSQRFIETLPKRGYRWIVDVHETTAPQNETDKLTGTDRFAPGDSAESPVYASRRGGHRVLTWTGKGLGYLGAFVLLASVSVWLIDQFVRAGPAVIAVLPVRAEASQMALATRIDQRLTEFMIGLDGVDVLSRSAVESRPANPYPYFYYEFGARWLVESELHRIEEGLLLTIELTDARAGIVLLQITEPIIGKQPAQIDLDRAIQALQSFLELQPGS